MIPHNLEAERGALGSCLLDGRLVADLREEHFYDVRHQRLLGVLREISREGLIIDPPTTVTRAAESGCLEKIGGAAYIGSLPDATPSAANFGYYLEILNDELTRRRLLNLSYKAAQAASERSPDRPLEDSLSEVERDASTLRPEAVVNQSNVEVIGQIIDNLEEAAKSPGVIRGLTTGIDKLDRLLCGMQQGQLIVIAARPGHGKTALGLQISLHLAAGKGVPVGFSSLEMTKEQLLLRSACMQARVDSTLAKRGTMSEAEQRRLIPAFQALRRAPLYIDDRSGQTVAQITAAGQKAVERGARLLVVDYLQLINADNRRASRYEQVTQVSNDLKAMAKRLGVPALCLAQLNRESEKDDRAPQMSDLRDSGAIEQDSDVIVMIHTDPKAADPSTGDEPGKLLVRKCREGRVGAADVIFRKRWTLFEADDMQEGTR